MGITVARRSLFVLALLWSSALSTICFHFTINNSGWPATGDAFSAHNISQVIGHMGWGAGADSLLFVLALWLAGRKGVWDNWRGYLRAAIYLAAFVYGRMLFSTTQEWFMQAAADGWSLQFPENSAAFRWPGWQHKDYARPAIDVLSLLITTWLMIPIFALTRSALADREQSWKASRTFSIASIMGWTVMAGLISTWVKFLTWDGVAPATYFSTMTPEAFFRLCVVQFAPGLLIAAIITWFIAWGWSGNRWLPLLVLIATLPLDSFAHRGAFAVLRWLGKDPGGGVIDGSPLEHWSYLGGRVAMAWCAIGIARALGVRLKRGLSQPVFENSPAMPT